VLTSMTMFLSRSSYLFEYLFIINGMMHPCNGACCSMLARCILHALETAASCAIHAHAGGCGMVFVCLRVLSACAPEYRDPLCPRLQRAVDLVVLLQSTV
jgi:hypothetical protein